MGYKIDPEKDRPFIEEFRQTPVGHHSPGLLRVLNAMRYDPSGYQIILVNRVPFTEWILGIMPPNRADDIALLPDRVFHTREEAEWAVFCLRWEKHTGERLNMPFRIGDGAEGDR